MTTPEVVLDANVIVGVVDAGDSAHVRAAQLLSVWADEERHVLLLDFLGAEAISVVCRRAAERKRRPPSLEPILVQVQQWNESGRVVFAPLGRNDFSAVLRHVADSQGRLNFNDARLVALQRSGAIGEVASFDADFDAVEGFRRIA